MKGVTLIELILVTAIIAILGASTTPFISQFLLRNQVESTTDKVISSIRKAQNYAMNGKNNATWGVCKTGSLIRFYSGSCSTPTTKEDFTIPQSVTVTGLLDTTFSKLRGEPSPTLSISISSAIKSHTVTVNAVGGMTIN